MGKDRKTWRNTEIFEIFIEFPFFVKYLAKNGNSNKYVKNFCVLACLYGNNLNYNDYDQKWSTTINVANGLIAQQELFFFLCVCVCVCVCDLLLLLLPSSPCLFFFCCVCVCVFFFFFFCAT